MKLNVKFLPVFKPLFAPSKRYRGAKGGRGSGKSHAMAEMLVVRCLAVPGTRALCVREIQKKLKESAKKLIEDKIKALAVGHLFEVLQTEIRTPGGGTIMFEGMQNHNAESIKGYENIDICWVEEAQTITERSIRMLTPTIRAEGSEIWFSWNPRRRSDPVEKLIPWGGDRAVLVHANYTDNPLAPTDILLDAEEAKRDDPDNYAHVWLGAYESMGSKTVIPAAWLDAAVGLVEDLGLDVVGKTVAALDVAGAEEGGDENALAVRKGIELWSVDKWNGFDTALTTTKAVKVCDELDVPELFYDSVGVGEGVTGEWAGMGRRAERPKGLTLIPWNGGAAVLDPDKRLDPTNPKSPKNKDQYENLKAQAWFGLRERCQNAWKARNGRDYNADALISIPRDLPNLQQLLDELTQPQQKPSKRGLIMVDKQPDGAKSPNMADSVVMAFHPLQSKYNLSFFA